MTWSPHVPADFRGEAAKVRYELVPYVRGAGIDIGCGPFKAFAHSIGIDGQQHSGPRGPQLVMDCTRLPMFCDGAFDYVFSSHLLEHVVDYAATVREWFRLVKVGGYLILYLPHRDLYPRIGNYGANPDHKHDFAPEDIRVAMEECADGWSLIRDEVRSDGYEYSFLQIYRKRYDVEHVTELPASSARKRACVIRPGAYGDALQASSAIAGLAREGFAVSVFTEKQGEEILRRDPNVAEIVDLGALPDGEWTGYWDWLETKFDRFVNLTESVEKNNIADARDLRFYWSDEARRAAFGGNYLELIHRIAQVPFDPVVRFHESLSERALAQSWAGARYPLAVIAVSGSTQPKFWPWVPVMVAALVERGYHIALVGDMRNLKIEETDRVAVLGTNWPLREALALAKQAQVVIGQETAILNAVGFEPMRKIVLLSHSTRENLTRDWVNTESLQGASAQCYPCHRIHLAQLGGKFCNWDRETKAAACQVAIGVGDVMRHVPAVVDLEKAA